MSVGRTVWGVLDDGQEVGVHTLRNARGAIARISEYGATLLELQMPDREERFANIVLGVDSFDQAVANVFYLGATIGRVAGRISDGRFRLGGVAYDVGQNSETFCLHGGEQGFSHSLWAPVGKGSTTPSSIELQLHEPAARNGFPGDVRCSVRYTLSDDNHLRIDYTASSTADTPFNPTHHSYFNLAPGGDILGHALELACDSSAVSTADGMARVPLRENYNDYRTATLLCTRDILDSGNADFYGFLPGGRVSDPRFAARVCEEGSGRQMEVFTTEPGLVFYAGLGLGEGATEAGEAGAGFGPCAGLCLETQDFADSVNHPTLGNAILKTGDTFRSTTEYRFSTF